VAGVESSKPRHVVGRGFEDSAPATHHLKVDALLTRAAGNFSHFSPILLSPKHSARLYTGASSVCQGRPRCADTKNRGNSSLGRRTARAREREREEEYMFRAELIKKIVRPEQRGTGCTDRQHTSQTVVVRLCGQCLVALPNRQQTFQTVTERLGDLGEPNVPRGTLGGAKSGKRDNRPLPNGVLTVRWANWKPKRPSPNGGIGSTDRAPLSCRIPKRRAVWGAQRD
jgi:hypothetical protein